ncbi:hypothetical protein M9H77_14804 [Catharanthus roseus]|uniref:Uncharacterized protein n=1 Tax=Catharanthus roseus TaxID=4058 RepID=A0ACC0BP56_CATRO|nr:hypothetical protein M9H77_14804 [Catharanthus roseus]
MEEVPAHVHPGPIVTDVLFRQHEHRSGLIWSGDREDGPAVAVAALSYPSDEYISWYKGITRVYIDNPANRNTHAHGYQPAGVDRRMMEMDDMASVAIWEPPSSPSQMAAVMKKVQTIIWRCMVSIGGTLGCTPSQHDIQATFSVQPSRRRLREHVPDRGARRVKKGARRHPGRGAGGRRLPVPPAPQRQEHVDPGPAVVERASQTNPSGSGTSQIPPALGLGFASFQTPHSAYGFSGFRASLPPSTAGSSTPHQPISQASSSDEEEQQDDVDGVQALGFGHRVGKKTVRFTPSDWP